MRTKVSSSSCAAAALLLAALPAAANIQSDRWFREVTTEGRDIHLTIQLIEEDPPNFDTTFTLRGGGGTIFRNKQFVRGEADAVVGPGCIEVNIAEFEGPDAGVPDCDGDGTGDCYGICGTAYLYRFTDECVEDDYWGYFLYDDANPGTEIDYSLAGAPLPDDSCLDSDGCAVAAPGRTAEAGLAALMLLVGLGCTVAARRR
jgi:hypothetical protein